ncbi:MAG: DUF2206 domain-containing protein [Euryarchaeota archaeon]|nr:DUF2206 domain-containing protein [Euryarchaeota archaeon]
MRLKPEYFGWFAITVILATNIAVFLNMPFLRLVSGFIFLIILPGSLIVWILKLNRIETVEKAALVAGLSVAFLLFFGLLLNNLLLAVGFETPLSTVSLIISFDIAFIMLLIVGCVVNKDRVFFFANPHLNRHEKAFMIIAVILLVLSVLGSYTMSITGNNTVLVAILLLIPTYIASVCLCNRKFPERSYPVMLYLISISLLLIYALRFPHIWGRDVHAEYYLFRTTLCNLHWGIVEHALLDACLSISLLPTIFQSIAGADAQEYLFKGVYVAICSFIPLAVYAISRRYVGGLYAFLASFFFISQSTFLSAAGSARTNVAIFFVALAVMVLFNDKIDPVKQRILFFVFMLAIVVSHYSTAYIFFFVVLFSWVAAEMVARKYVFERTMNLRIVLFFFVVIFIWYAQLTDAAFSAGVTFIKDTLANLNNFFLEESRTEMFHLLLGKGLAYSVLSTVNLLVTWCTFIFIGIGVLTMVRKFQGMVDIRGARLRKPNFLKTRFEVDYLTMVLACSGLLMAIVLLPYISVGYDICRLYSLVIVVLSVCFVMGGMVLSKRSGLTSEPYLIILVILLSYSMFVTGVAYQIFGAPVSTILNSEGDAYACEYIHDSESCAAKWLAPMVKETPLARISVTDFFGSHRLLSQGTIPPGRIDDYSFSGQRMTSEYIYLYYTNAVMDKLVVNDTMCNMSEYRGAFTGYGRVYDSGSSEIYKR